MYQNYRRNKFATRAYGQSWPYVNQPNYQQYQQYGSTYPSEYPMQTGYSQIPYQQFTSYPGFNPYTPYPTPYQQQPYPINSFMPQQKKGTSGILTQFKKKDGTYDINKLMDTAGQMVGAVNQVNSIVKGLTKTFKV